MSPSKIGRRMALSAPLLASIALALPAGSPAASEPAPPPAPHASTTTAAYVLATSAMLTAVINPEGLETSYYFQYGPTTAYGSQTPTVSVGAGVAEVKVGKPVSKLQTGVTYHYRVVAVTSKGVVVLGLDRSFTTKTQPLRFEVEQVPPVPFGTPFILSGTLTGFGNANHQVALQASPYPYLEAFTEIGVPAVTNAAGRFAFRVANLASSTQFRVGTLDQRPLYSPVVTVHAAVKVTLHVHSSGQPGLVRLYGTVTPAEVGAQVSFQLRKAVRPKPSEATTEQPEVTTRFVSQFATVVKKAGRTFSRFSTVVSVRLGGRYRAFVKVRPGALASGYSQTVVLHAAPTTVKKTKRKG
jgi:hypothetical protein